MSVQQDKKTESGSSGVATAPPREEQKTRQSTQAAKLKPRRLPPYHVVLLNDDDHSCEYVIEMMKSIFGFPNERGYQIAKQVDSVAQTLSMPPERIYPVSAQKGLVAKVQNDPALLRRSRLSELEAALSSELVPQQQEVVREHVRRGFDELFSVTHSVLQARRRNLVEQLFELNSLRGKNRNVVDLMANRIKGERIEFEKSLRHLQALRAVFSRHSQSIYAAVGVDGLKRHVRGARDVMRASNFSLGLRDGMTTLMTEVRGDFDDVSRMVDEISTLMTAMYKTFNSEHGLTLGSPLMFSVRRYYVELDRIEALYRKQFGAITLVTTEKWALMRRFFESVASRIKEVYELANRELETWLRAVIAPIEGQVREHQLQLRRRLDSVKRVLDASDSLEGRIVEIDDGRSQIEQQVALAGELANQVRMILDQSVPIDFDRVAAAETAGPQPAGSQPAGSQPAAAAPAEVEPTVVASQSATA